MALTINENGKAITETIDGVQMPTDYSFETVNDFVHNAEVHFEELQSLCLGMADRIDRLAGALQAVKQHQEIVGGSMHVASKTWHIANKAMSDT